jgi:hypothetical protein
MAIKPLGYISAGHEYRRLALAWWSIDTDQVFEGLVQER